VCSGSSGGPQTTTPTTATRSLTSELEALRVATTMPSRGCGSSAILPAQGVAAQAKLGRTQELSLKERLAGLVQSVQSVLGTEAQKASEEVLQKPGVATLRAAQSERNRTPCLGTGPSTSPAPNISRMASGDKLARRADFSEHGTRSASPDRPGDRVATGQVSRGGAFSPTPVLSPSFSPPPLKESLAGSNDLGRGRMPSPQMRHESSLFPGGGSHGSVSSSPMVPRPNAGRDNERASTGSVLSGSWNSYSQQAQSLGNLRGSPHTGATAPSRAGFSSRR